MEREQHEEAYEANEEQIKETEAAGASESADGAAAPETKEAADAENSGGDAETESPGPENAGEEVEAAEGGNGEAADAGGPQQSSDGKWHVFGRKKEKKDPKDLKIEELTDQLRRTMAEFDNFRKRTEKEKSAMFEIGAKDIVERILPVIDNFERGLSSMPEEVKGTPFADGMEMIYKQLLKNLEDAGVKPIEAVGQPFDPNFHNAVMHVEDENLGENVVAAELQKGYMYRDSVVRHSMVQVAN